MNVGKIFSKVGTAIRDVTPFAKGKNMLPMSKGVINDGGQEITKSLDALAAYGMAGIKKADISDTTKIVKNVQDDVAKNADDIPKNSAKVIEKSEKPAPVFKTEPAGTSTPETVTIEKVVNGEVAQVEAKNAEYSAEIFNGQAALDAAVGPKAKKSAMNSAAVFLGNGKTPVEKALDEAARKEKLIQQIGPERWEKLQQQKAQQALKAQLLAKHSTKLQ